MEYSQDRQGPLGNLQLGNRLRELLDRDGAAAQGGRIEVPDDPGPALAGRTPVIGMVRRSRDLPVLRDNLGDIGS